jgi:solute carrier family 25 protein 46
MTTIATHHGSPSILGGLGGELAVIILQGLSENMLNESRYLPKSWSDVNGVTAFLGHLANQCIGFLLSSPFYAASIVESVQSHVDGDTSTLLSSMESGISRILGRESRSPHFLPLYITTPLFIGYSLLQYSTEILVQSCLNRLTSLTQTSETNSSESSILSVFYPQLLSGTISTAVSGMLLYPLQTVLHRLVVQGTQTVIDNTETGVGCVPVHTAYRGFVDCWGRVIQEEGWSGLYKGFSALLLQVVLGMAILQTAKVIFTQFARDIQSGRRQ